MYNIIMISSRFYHITSRMSLLLKVGGGGGSVGPGGGGRVSLALRYSFFLWLVGWGMASRTLFGLTLFRICGCGITRPDALGE